MLIAILVLVAIVYCCLPWYIELACFIINLFIPDTIPIIDELLMFVPIVRKIKNIITLSEIFKNHLDRYSCHVGWNHYIFYF